MPPRKSALRPQATNLAQLKSAITGTPVTARSEALEDLAAFFRNPSLNHEALKDKEYHSICEALFRAALVDKELLLSGKGVGTANERLRRCARALRETVGHGVSKFKGKTVRAIIDHITDTLPTYDGDFLEPLAKDYMQTFVLLLDSPTHVENLALKDGSGWEQCVMFVLDRISNLLDSNDSAPASILTGRDSPVPGTARQSSVGPSSARSRPGTQRGTVQVQRNDLLVLLQCLQSLFSAPNAPYMSKRKEVADAVLQVLRLRYDLDKLHRFAFSILNSILLHTAGDDPALGQHLTRELVPLLGYWWQSRTLDKDELQFSVRDEMLKTMHAISVYLDYLLQDDPAAALLQQVEELLDELWGEYSSRNPRARLQLDDVTFSSLKASTGHFATDLFALKPFDQHAERRWALVAVMSRLEFIFLQHSKSNSQRLATEDRQPRKRQRRAGGSNRIHQKLLSSDVGVKLTSLQLLPFFLPLSNLDQEEILTVMEDLLPMIGDKQGLLSSWAMIACASCALQSQAKDESTEARWKQVWQLAVRSISIPSTCRAACVLLHVILQTRLVPHHAIANDVNNIVTMADICGPATLLDSSLVFMHCLANIRNSLAPSASQKTSSFIIRWAFTMWRPSEATYASSLANNMVPIDLVNLLLLCCGVSQFEIPRRIGLVGGGLSQFWKCYNDTIPMTRYLLLLSEDEPAGSNQYLIQPSGGGDGGQFSDLDEISTSQPSSSQTSKTLILDLLHPKLVDFVEMLEPASQTGIRRADVPTMHLSSDRLRSMVACLISSSILLSHLEVAENRGINDVNALLSSLWERVFRMVVSSGSTESFELVLAMLAPYIPPLDSLRVQQFCSREPHLLQLFASLSGMIDEHRNQRRTTQDSDAMDVDDAFETRDRRKQPGDGGFTIPRRKTASSMSTSAFFETTKARLQLFSEYFRDLGKVGLIPDNFMDKFLSLEDDRFLLCREFLVELLQSDFGNVSNYAKDIVEQTAAIVFKNHYKTSEVALCTLVDVLLSFAPVWSMGEGDADVINPFVDLYNLLVKSVWPNNLMSPEVQLSYSELLLHLWGTNAQFHKDKKSLVSPPHKTLLSTPESLKETRAEIRDPRPGPLWDGCMRAKFYIAPRLTTIFEFFVVSTHEDIFVDILKALPTDPEMMEGIGLRVFVLAGLGCKCPTLLRRSVYHIVETSGKVVGSAKYATRGMKMVSLARSLKSPQELFQLFAPQLLYTWLEKDSFEDIPFSIFGFASLDDLLQRSSIEATALMIMRCQDEAVNDLASRLQVTPVTLVEQGYSKIMAYSIMHDLSTSKDSSTSSESRVRKLLGKELWLEFIYRNFADIIGHFCDLIDQEDVVEDAWRRDETFAYAADWMDQIKRCGQSSTSLGPNQQPMFKGKYLNRAISHLVRRTSYDVMSMWTQPLVTSVARRLLNTIHPALGPLHALSVIRKVRILICLAGAQTTSSYPLEMLLRSIRPFLSDSQCADEALAMSNWLISQGQVSLAQTPSFLAGYALSTLASLRMFLESSQASSTEESQFKSTVSKAQNFHGWFVKLLKGYDSSSAAFKSDKQAQAFKAIIESASNIRSSGNSQKDTQESRLLLEILKDAEQEAELLNESARDLALRMLCGEFKIPKANRDDIIDTDDDARAHGPMIWKSCKAVNSSKEYLTWAGRVVGTSYAASGSIPRDVLRESQLSSYQRTMGINGDSVHGLLRILAKLTLRDNSIHAGLAESALRRIVSHASSTEDHDLIADCSRSLPENLLASSDWSQYQTPPTDSGLARHAKGGVFEAESIESSTWAQDIAIHLACSVKRNAVLTTLPSILSEIGGFAEQALPFIAHLALLEELNSQRPLKRGLSTAFKEWLKSGSPAASDNIKLVVNVILHLRTRPFPNEGSIADRSHWLDLDLASVAEAATGCGMYKVALLFAELASSETVRSSRRSSAAARETEDSPETLLKVFENIDDPDAYYGLNRTASLSNVLARLEFEKEGGKSLAFRGSQYDSHLRLRDSEADRDGQSLVQILSGLGLAGLSNSLLQVQQHHDDSASLDGTFTTARRLEIWNLPAPPSLENHAATSYRAYQSIYRAVEMDPARLAVQDGLATTMKRLATKDLRVSDLRQHLGTLAALTELDTVLGVTNFAELEKVLADFEARSTWMMSGRYDDVSQILSHRETTFSVLGQKNMLRSTLNLTSPETRLVEVRSMLLSSSIYRFHHARQESLNVATKLTDLVGSSEAIGLNIDAAVSMETANSFWDYGEMIPSIRLLQGLQGSPSSLKKQSIPVTHADLLSKIGYQVSVAKLETADSIQKKYLEPALKELKGKSSGKEAGQVFHQFAVFCDEQLQDPDMLQDLGRLQRLVQTKADEVEHYKKECRSAKVTQLKEQFERYQRTAEKYLLLDQTELQRTQRTRNEFVKLSLENYLQSLSASDDHDSDALRFTALWLEQSETDVANAAVHSLLRNVPTRKFASLMNQLSSRLQLDKTHFQTLLRDLVCRICFDHPYHGMYQIWSGIRTNPNAEDEVAQLRKSAATKLTEEFERQKGSVAITWDAIKKACGCYHYLAKEKNELYRSGARLKAQDSPSAATLSRCLARYPIPPPTMEIELRADRNYSMVPVIERLDPTMSIASGVSAPKIITVVASNGQRYKQLVKGGNDDLRQDAIMEQVFAAVSSLLKQHRTTRQRNLGIRTYKVLPLTARSGLIEFVANTIPLHDWLMPAHERYYPKDMKGNLCRKEISNVATRTNDVRVSTYRKVAEKFHPVMRYFFIESFPDPDDWYIKRLAYTRTTAAISMLGHVLGLGDRHGHNILLDQKTGEVVHIDLGVAFESGRILPVPEVVPFRMTRDVVDGMGVTKTDGVFRRCCEFTLDALREETYSIMTILDVLRYDPLYSWSSTPMRLAKLQGAARRAEEEEDQGGNGAGGGAGADKRKKKTVVNEPSEADRALEVVRKKLSKTLSVTATVNDLINQATDERNLAVLYSGWAAYA
ncbi:hypothetical protein KVR01_008848 [Diaporthe batatas]|uniref:DNA-binding protein kinase TEL1 n=1 Tax=Diaporthe batatas TaxID=748121 RepID=UPI001D04A920|nr:DNA-binding protein kinase TEL1 [Diaporthe batatas]KAG8161861.1 hypothetical protein KVR01_008848 [Diaporthe batatas]